MEILRNEKLSKQNKFKRQKTSNQPIVNLSNNNPNIFLEDDLIRLCLSEDLSIRKLIFDYMQKDWLQSENHKKIYDMMYIHFHTI